MEFPNNCNGALINMMCKRGIFDNSTVTKIYKTYFPLLACQGNFPSISTCNDMLKKVLIRTIMASV